MLTFEYRFTRYDRTSCERRITGRQTVKAETFGDALTRICDRLLGLKDADPTNDYELLDVAVVGTRGVDCEGGGRLFETQAEFVERVSEGLTPPDAEEREASKGRHYPYLDRDASTVRP